MYSLVNALLVPTGFQCSKVKFGQSIRYMVNFCSQNHGPYISIFVMKFSNENRSSKPCTTNQLNSATGPSTRRPASPVSWPSSPRYRCSSSCWAPRSSRGRRPPTAGPHWHFTRDHKHMTSAKFLHFFYPPSNPCLHSATDLQG